MASDLFGQLSRLVVSDIPGRRSDHLRYAVLLHVFGHIHADHALLGTENRLRQGFGQFGLSDACRAEEEEAADRTLRILESHPAALDG